MTIKRGSLIRRLAQERRDTPEENAPAGGAGLAISLGGLIAEETPAPAAAPVAAASPTPAPVTPSPAPEPASALPPLPAVILPPAPLAEPEKMTPSSAKPAEKHAHAAPRLARLPGRQRRRHGDVCVRHPGEAKRNAGARAWLTPEESEKLELLATAYQISTSTLTREIIVEGLEAHADLIEKTRRFLDSLGKGRVGA
jgi:hypothetical protein